jgi:hypothetical protein
MAWAAVTVPATAAVSALVEGRDGYLVVLFLLASGAYTTPTLVVGWLVVRRVEPAERTTAALWFASLVLMYAAGVGVLAGVVFGADQANAAGAPVLVAIAGLILAGNVRLVRDGSGERAVLVDVVDCLTWTLVVTAPAALVWGDDIAGADEAWFAVPAALAAVGMLAGAFWMALLVTRRRGSGPAIGAYLIAFTLLGALDAALQVAQATSGFTLPAPPLVGLHAACASLVLLIPLHIPQRPTAGLGTLAPHRQVRGGASAAFLPVAGLPTVAVALAANDADGPTATTIAGLGALTALALLAAARQALVQRETRHLYAQLEHAADRRRHILADLVRNTDDDRHRIATTFHRHAVSAYAGFVTFLQAASTAPSTRRAVATSGAVRDDLARHVDALRDLVTATTTHPDRHAHHPLAVLAAAHLEGLYGDTPTPHLDVTITEAVALDWEVEATLVRIIQQALDDIAARGDATTITTHLDTHATTLVLTVTDDANPPTIGDHAHTDRLASIHALAGTLAGWADTHPTTGSTTVRVVLDPAAAPARPDEHRRHLHLAPKP